MRAVNSDAVPLFAGINSTFCGIYRPSAILRLKRMSELFQKLKWILILWLARRLPDCKTMTRTLGESLDRRAGWRESIVTKLHLFTCEACKQYLDQIGFLKEAAHVHGERDPHASEFSAATLSAESKARLKALLRHNIGPAI
jgi:hypothetical protein